MILHLFYYRVRAESFDKIAEIRRILVLFGEESEMNMVVKRYALKKCVEMQKFYTLKP